MHECHITVPRTARYFTLGAAARDVQEVWFVCHGYGQLARDFIEDFHALADDRRLVVAPEGLSRFYLTGVSGKIGASWMTSEHRLSEIQDYVAYLELVYGQIFEQVNRSEVRVCVLGFSQGTATACRWLTQGDAQADKLILWGGGLPLDIDLLEKKTLFEKLNLTLVVGATDEFATPELVAKQESTLTQLGIPYQLLRFEGGHLIHEPTLLQVARG